MEAPRTVDRLESNGKATDSTVSEVEDAEENQQPMVRTGSLGGFGVPVAWLRCGEKKCFLVWFQLALRCLFVWGGQQSLSGAQGEHARDDARGRERVERE